MTESDINYIIKECVNRIILNESMTDIAFHFTTYQGLIGILKSNEFRLGSQDEHYQKKASTTKPYYMCVTRQKYGDTGYNHIRDDFKVRITLNGRLFNQRYKTIVYDYYASNGDLSAREEEIKNNGGKLPYKQPSVENEERLLSEKPTIPNASKYILRIDILYGYDLNLDISLLEKLDLSNKTFAYYNKNDFDLQNKNCKNISLVKSPVKEINSRIKNGESIDNIFDDHFQLKNGFQAVSYNNKWNILNNKNKLISKEWFYEITDEIDKFIIVNKLFGKSEIDSEDKYNLISYNGILLLDIWADFIEQIDNGMILICSYDNGIKLAYNGHLLTNQWFDNIDDIEEKYVKVSLDEKWYIIYKSGKIYDENNNRIK